MQYTVHTSSQVMQLIVFEKKQNKTNEAEAYADVIRSTGTE